MPYIPSWIIAILACIGAPIGAYIGVRVAISNMTARLVALERELGDHETGIRGRLHHHHGVLGKHRARIWRLEEKAGIPPWDEPE